MNIFKELEAALIKLWNQLYLFLCEYFGEEVNEEWFVPEDESIFDK